MIFWERCPFWNRGQRATERLPAGQPDTITMRAANFRLPFNPLNNPGRQGQ